MTLHVRLRGGDARAERAMLATIRREPASRLPARRATRIAPVAALRAQ